MDFDENLGWLELWDRSFLQGEAMEAVHLREAPLAGRFGERHYADMAFKAWRIASSRWNEKNRSRASARYVSYSRTRLRAFSPSAEA